MPEPPLKILPPEPETDSKKTIAFINGSAILKKDKMVGWINDRITRGLLWLRDEIETATVTIMPEEAKGRGHISFQLLRTRTQLIPRIEGDQWSVTVKFETDDDVIQNTTNLNLNNPELTKNLEVQLASDIEKRIRAALVRPQKQLNADIFDFAYVFRRKYPKEWKTAKDRWDEIFPNIPVYVEAKAKILHSGNVSEKATLPKQEVKQKK
ncbi:Ger(x)C family spore germination C-terminal domain-containing protein [Paenibacillus sp. WC2504]|uniref:Ger(x)C family spore germination C-terminal domain-containing protein n=1 Tax=Paenibacillus sp. WC2504 TaxID=3461403 RepID=UPI0040462A58